jgi:hypothetical protein
MTLKSGRYLSLLSAPVLLVRTEAYLLPSLYLGFTCLCKHTTLSPDLDPEDAVSTIFRNVVKTFPLSHINSIHYVTFRSHSLFSLLIHSRCREFLWFFHLITLRHTPQSVGLLWTRDRPVAETSTWQHKHCTRQTSMPPGGIRTHDPSKRSAADVRLRRRRHWHRLHHDTLW